MTYSIDWWRADRGAFVGERCFLDATGTSREESARALARVLILETAAGWLCDQSVPFSYAETAPYLDALFDIDDAEGEALWRCLAALQSSDTAALATALNDAGRIAAARGAAEGGRACAELAYDAALACGSWAEAHKAALLLERLAELDECPRAAERWARRAQVHGARVRRARRRRI